MTNSSIVETIVGMCNHVLSLDKEAFFDFQLPELSREDWEELLACAAKQGMLPTVVKIIEGRQC
jgi:hypothetical protein